MSSETSRIRAMIRTSPPELMQEMAQTARLALRMIEEAEANSLPTAEFGINSTGLTINIDADGAADLRAWTDTVTQIAGARPSEESRDRYEESRDFSSISEARAWSDCQGTSVYLSAQWTKEDVSGVEGS